MAEDRTFTLIGNFTDNITPKLRSINEQITALNGTIAKFKENGRSLSKEFGTVAASLDALTKSSRDNNRALNSTISDLQRYVNLLNQVATAQGRINARPITPGGSGGGRAGGGGVVPQKGNNGPAGSSVFRDAGNVFGITVGNTVSNLVSNAIIGGFRVGVGLMEKPFQYFGKAFVERIQDETTDIQAAGGLFSVSQRKGLGLFPDFNSAMREQQKINYKLAQSAAALPGSTAEYVKQGKLLTDTVITVLANDKEKSIKFGQSLGGEGTASGALQTIVQKLTEKSVLLQQGTTSRSVYGVPQLIEKLINSEEVSPAMFNKYVSFRDNPILNNAFKEMSGEIGKTGANTADRIKLVYKLLDKALPNEVIQAYKSSVAGTFENLRSLFLDPEVGLFGLGRKFKNVLAPEVNQFGQYINKQGKVTKELSEAAMQQVSIYDMLKDIIVGFGNPIAELVPVLMQLYDPLQGMIGDLLGMRTIAQDFYRNFHSYSAWFAKFGKDIGSVNITQTSGARGALAAINNLLAALDVVSDTEFVNTGNALKDRNANLPQIASKLLSQLMGSEFMETLGKMIGRIIGDVLSMVAKLMSGATNFVTAGGFAGGLKAGFDESGGPEAISIIIKSVFSLLWKAITAVVTAAPFESLIVGAAVVGIPALSAVAATAFSGFVQSLFNGKAIQAVGGMVARRAAKQAAVAAAANAVPAALGSASARLLGLGGGLAAGAPIYTGAAGAAGAGAAGAAGAGAAGAGVATAAGPLAVAAGIILTAAYVYKKSAEAADGTESRNSQAAYIQKLAADLQKQTADLARGDIKTEKILSFGSAADLSKRFQSLGYSDKDPFLQKYRQREVAQDKLKVLTDEYNKQKAAVEGLGIGQEAVTRRLAPLKSQIDLTKGSLKVAQTDLETTFKGLGPKVQDALISNLANFTISVGGTLIDKNGTVHPATLNNQVSGFKEIFAGGANPPPGAGNSLLPNKSSFNVPQNTGVWDINNPAFSRAYGSPGTKFSNLGGAISYEMANKPSGSNLVVANSSETVIPAAGGLGMGRLVDSIFTSARATGDTIAQAAQQAGSMIMGGFSTLTNATQQGDKAIVSTQQSSTAKLQDSIAQSTQAQLAGQQQLMTAIQQAAASGGGGFGGGGGGGIFGGGAGAGGVAKTIAVGKMLQGMGLNVAEHPAFGDGRVGRHATNSFHYEGRAIDVTGPAATLDAAYAKLKGTNPAELLWRTAGHYDHLHAAYALGPGNPAFFSSQSAAEAWEKSMVPGSAKIGSITTNSNEALGGQYSISNNITINQQPGQSPKELAALVALEISNTVADIRNSSYNV